MGWRLLTSTYVVTEIERNLSLRLPAVAELAWRQLSPMLQSVADVVTFNWPTLVGVGKDRPVIFTAARRWFGSNAGLPGTDFRVVLERDGGGYTLAALGRTS
jgi:hypothetical protein